jgi:hypothetical protein
MSQLRLLLGQQQTKDFSNCFVGGNGEYFTKIFRKMTQIFTVDWFNLFIQGSRKT